MYNNGPALTQLVRKTTFELVEIPSNRMIAIDKKRQKHYDKAGVHFKNEDFESAKIENDKAIVYHEYFKALYQKIVHGKLIIPYLTNLN
jgi:hypothetical protein